MANSRKSKKNDSAKSKPQIAKKPQSQKSEKDFEQTLVDKVSKNDEKQNNPKLTSESVENIDSILSSENSLQKTDQNTNSDSKTTITKTSNNQNVNGGSDSNGNKDNASENPVVLDKNANMFNEDTQSKMLDTTNNIIISTESDGVYNKSDTASKIDEHNKDQVQQANITNKTNGSDELNEDENNNSKTHENLMHSPERNLELGVQNNHSEGSDKQQLLESHNNSKTLKEFQRKKNAENSTSNSAASSKVLRQTDKKLESDNTVLLKSEPTATNKDNGLPLETNTSIDPKINDYSTIADKKSTEDAFCKSIESLDSEKTIHINDENSENTTLAPKSDQISSGEKIMNFDKESKNPPISKALSPILREKLKNSISGYKKTQNQKIELSQNTSGFNKDTSYEKSDLENQNNYINFERVKSNSNDFEILYNEQNNEILQLKQSLENNNSIVQDIQSELKLTKQQNINLNSNYMLSKHKVIESEKKVELLNSDLKKLRHQMDELQQKQNTHTQSHTENIVKENKQLNESMVSFEKKISDLKTNLSTFKNQNKNLESELDDAKNQISEINLNNKSVIENLQNKLNEDKINNSKTYENLQRALKRNHELEAHNKQSEDLLKQQLLESQNNSKTVTQELTSSNNTLDELNKKLAEMSSLHETFKSESNKKIEKLTKSLEQADVEIKTHIDKQNTFDTTLASAQDQIKKFKFTSDSVLERKSELEKNNDELKQKISNLETKLSGMSSDFELKNNTLEQNKIIIANYTEQLQSAKDQLDKIHALNNELQKDKVDLTKEIQTVKQELLEQSGKVDELVKSNKELIESQELSQQTTIQLQSDLLEYENNKKKYGEEINQKNMEIEKNITNLSEELKAIKAENDTLTANINILETENDILEANGLELEELNKANATKLEVSSKHVKDIEVQLSSANKSIQDKNAEINKLAEQLSLSIVSNEEKDTVVSDLNKNVANLQILLEEKTQSYDKINTELNVANDELKQASIKYTGLDKMHTSLQTNFETAYKNIEQLELQIKEHVYLNNNLNFHIGELNEAKSKADKELEELHKSLSEKKHAVTQLTIQLENSKKEQLDMINSHKNEIESKNYENQNLQSIITAKMVDLTSIQLQSDSTMRSKNNKISELKGIVYEKTQNIEKMNNQLEDNKADIKSSNLEIKKLKSIISAKELDLSNTKEDLYTMTYSKNAEMDALQKKIDVNIEFDNFLSKHNQSINREILITKLSTNSAPCNIFKNFKCLNSNCKDCRSKISTYVFLIQSFKKVCVRGSEKKIGCGWDQFSGDISADFCLNILIHRCNIDQKNSEKKLAQKSLNQFENFENIESPTCDQICDQAQYGTDILGKITIGTETRLVVLNIDQKNSEKKLAQKSLNQFENFENIESPTCDQICDQAEYGTDILEKITIGTETRLVVLSE
ncbi:hypothetical protein BB561_001548 [Smittium simulii]|uniref:Uncharacterized protein n=1 Tax=Smittium simulii TaxID=133385 RepID=A0A2T9YU25_9FUNG|nr:hypothetical protein BB561_001548 [Smittium simulii]